MHLIVRQTPKLETLYSPCMLMAREEVSFPNETSLDLPQRPAEREEPKDNQEGSLGNGKRREKCVELLRNCNIMTPTQMGDKEPQSPRGIAERERESSEI